MAIWLQNTLILLSAAAMVALIWAFLRTERSRRAVQRYRRDRLAMISFFVVVLYLMVGLLDALHVSPQKSILDMAFSRVQQESGYSAPLSKTTFNERSPEPLKSLHLLGTDQLGHDVLHQTLKGCRTALFIGGFTTLIYIPIGTLLGILAGYFRGWVDDLIQYIYSTLASIPGILLLIALLMQLDKKLSNLVIALSITGWIGLCRLIRGDTLRQAARPYVEAARAIGQSHTKIIFRHLLPNVSHLIMITAILGFSGLVMIEAILSYLGVGAPVGTASWGAMIDAGRMELSRDPVVWWPVGAASGALFLFVLCLNIVGDALRRAFDPKSA